MKKILLNFRKLRLLSLVRGERLEVRGSCVPSVASDPRSSERIVG